jgi:hypothetical protein
LRASDGEKRHPCDASQGASRFEPVDLKIGLGYTFQVKISKSAVTLLQTKTMSSSNTETQVEAQAAKAVVPKQKKLKPARKQVKPGDVDKETAPQTGKEL